MKNSIISSWSNIKSNLISRGVRAQYLSETYKYIVYCLDGDFKIYCEIDKHDTDTTELDDFENNYKANANIALHPTNANGEPMSCATPFSNSGGYKFRGLGFSGTATKNTTTNIDYKMTSNRSMNGMKIICKNHVDGDSIIFQVVDLDNTLGYGAGLVLNQFGTDWYVDESSMNQGIITLPFRTDIYADLYIRFKYNSIGLTDDVKFKANLFLYKAPS